MLPVYNKINAEYNFTLLYLCVIIITPVIGNKQCHPFTYLLRYSPMLI